MNNINSVLDFVYTSLIYHFKVNPDLNWVRAFEDTIVKIKEIPTDLQTALDLINQQRAMISKQDELIALYKKEIESQQKLIDLYAQLDMANQNFIRIDKLNEMKFLLNNYLTNKVGL